MKWPLQKSQMTGSQATGRETDNGDVPSGNGRADNMKYPVTLTTVTIVLGLFLGAFLVAIDQTIIGTAIPKITDQFQTIKDAGWYGSAYFLTSTALQPTWGRVYKSFDAKWAYVTAITLFEIGSLVCAAAPSSIVFIIGRAVAGLGVAGVFSGNLVIVSSIVPLQKRPMIFGLFGAVWGVAFVLGPLLGGAFTDHLTWRWCFYINLPLGAVSLGVILLVLNPPPLPESETLKPLLQRLKELELIGATLLTAAITCLLLVLQWGGNTYSWSDRRIIGLLVVFALLMAVFVCTQIRLGERATLPPRIVSQRTVAAASIFVVFHGGASYLLMFYLPVFFQGVRGSSAVESGIQLLPILLGVVFSSFMIGVLISFFGFYTPFLIGSTALFTIGAGLITTYNAAMSDAAWIGFQVLTGAGLGAGFQVPQAAVQTVLSQEDISIGSPALIFFQSLGSSIFLSVGQSVFQNSLSAALAKTAPSVNPDLVFSAGETGLRQALERAGQSGAWPAVLAAYTLSLQDTYKVIMGLVLCAFLATLFFEWKSVKGGQGNLEQGQDNLEQV